MGDRSRGYAAIPNRAACRHDAVADIVRKCGRLVHRQYLDLPGGVYNFGSPNEYSTYETVRKLFEEVGIDSGKVQKNEVPFREKPRNLAMAQEKLNSCGIKFSSTLDALVRKIKNAM